MKELLLGNEAIARGAFEAGVTVVSSYPGTPSTEITEAIVKYENINVEWAPNEKVAAEVTIGASIAGARAMSCMKHVGMNVMADPLFTVSYTGVNGGLVFVVADDPGMHSSQNEQDSRHYAKASKIMMLEPSDSFECKEFTKEAFSLSEKFDTPVIIRTTTRVAHSQSLVDLNEPEKYVLKDYEKNIGKYVMMPGNAIKRHVIIEERMRKIEEFAEETEINKIINNNSKIGIISSGVAHLYASEALNEKVDYLKLGLVYPLPKKKIIDFVNSHDEVYVIEELDPFIEEFVTSLGLNVKGKSLFTLLGEYSPAMIRKVVLKTDEKPFFTVEEQIPVRPPVMCVGCPHRAVFYILKKLNLVVSGDIGCYTLGAVAPLSAMDTTICMGASVGVGFGMAKARGKEFAKKLVSVIGDSTFIHSGITGLIDIVYNKGANTVIILDNSITGMTGHQDNPTTGFTIRREQSPQVDLVSLVKSLGIKRVVVCDPFDLKKFEQIVKEEVASDEASVIIAQRKCALLKPIIYSGRCKITANCKNCKACMKIGCPAISIKDEKVVIDENQCNGCGLCMSVCPFDAIVKEDI